MTRVVVDIRANHGTGIARYGLSLLPEFTGKAQDAGWDVIVVCDQAQATLAHSGVIKTGAPVLISPYEDGFVRRSPWLRHLLERTAPNLYYTTHYTVDRHCPVPFVFTIHDLTRLRHPELSYTDESFARRFGLAELHLARREATALGSVEVPGATSSVFSHYFRALTVDLARRAERVVTVSRTSARDIHDLLGVEVTSMDIVPCAVDRSTFHPQPSERVAHARQRYGLHGPYILVVGLAHPNKRLPWLVEQVLRGRDHLPEHSQIAIVGGYAEGDGELQRLLDEHEGHSLVTFTGRISDDDLAALYTGASALVSASVSEGYCLPPAEAVACAAPVLVADIPALRETLGDSAHYFPAHDEQRFRDLAIRALRGLLPAPKTTAVATDWSRSGDALFRSLSTALVSERAQRRAAADSVYNPDFRHMRRIRS